MRESGGAPVSQRPASRQGSSRSTRGWLLACSRTIKPAPACCQPRSSAYALAALTLLFATLFIGAENPTSFRLVVALASFFVVFPLDQGMRLLDLVLDRRPQPKDFLFSAALDPSEGHVEPVDYTLIGVITEVRKLNRDEDD